MTLRKPKKLERAIENDFLRRLKTLGLGERLKTRKMNGLGNASWPDRLIIGPRGFAVWIEFKRPGEPLTKGQEDLHAELRAIGQTVAVFDDAKKAANWVRDRLL